MKLLPCPLCGASASIQIDNNDEVDSWEVECDNWECGLIFSANKMPKEIAIQLWNSITR